jgi:hypothetical protein
MILYDLNCQRFDDSKVSICEIFKKLSMLIIRFGAEDGGAASRYGFGYSSSSSSTKMMRLLCGSGSVKLFYTHRSVLQSKLGHAKAHNVNILWMNDYWLKSFAKQTKLFFKK